MNYNHATPMTEDEIEAWEGRTKCPGYIAGKQYMCVCVHLARMCMCVDMYLWVSRCPLCVLESVLLDTWAPWTSPAAAVYPPLFLSIHPCVLVNHCDIFNVGCPLVSAYPGPCGSTAQLCWISKPCLVTHCIFLCVADSLNPLAAP